ncbi:MAG: hypothetical protein KQJ78_12050 [Deltaproteobacteria bacterium]|nr:hypothetical protein [Deltaproteobacteria bacterium]
MRKFRGFVGLLCFAGCLAGCLAGLVTAAPAWALGLQDTAMSQAYARGNYDYGMYVFQGWGNYDNQPVVVGYFMQSQQPGADYYPDQAELWRWTEIDWEFVPQTLSSSRELIEGVQDSKGNLTYNMYRSKAYNDASQVSGEWTDDLVAQAIGLNGNHPDVTSWQDLVNHTQAGDYWAAGDGGSPTWGFPPSLAQPSRNDLENSVALNLFRMPQGQQAVTAGGVTSDFVPSVSTAVSGANITNQAFYWAKDAKGDYAYDPTGLHTYTVVWGPNAVNYYIDAPEDGTGVDGLAPVRTFTKDDYPSLFESSLDAPGGEETWYCNGMEKKLNNLLMIVNVYPFDGWGGTLGADFERARTFVRSMAQYPFKDAASAQNTTFTAADFITDPSNPDVFYFDASTWTAADARYNLQKNFYLDLDGIYNTPGGGLPTFQSFPSLTKWQDGTQGSTPDGQGAIEFSMAKWDTDYFPTQDYYYLTMVRGADASSTDNILVTIDEPGQSFVQANSYNFTNLAPFWGDTGTVLTVNAQNLATGDTNSCQIELTADLTWTIVPNSWADATPSMQFLKEVDAQASSQPANAGNIPVYGFSK